MKLFSSIAAAAASATLVVGCSLSQPATTPPATAAPQAGVALPGTKGETTSMKPIAETSRILTVSTDAWPVKDQPELKRRIISEDPLWELGVGIPISTTQMMGWQHWVPNPNGKTWDLIQWYYPNYAGPFTGIVMDFGSGAVSKIGLPLRRQARGGYVVGGDGKLYLSEDPGTGIEIYVYDPATNQISLKGLPDPNLFGETVPLARGPDGNIYGGGTITKEHKAGAYQIDVKTGKMTSYGALGPAHPEDPVYGYSIAADERYVYLASGKIPWYLIAYDRQTGKSEVLVETAKTGEDIGVAQSGIGCTAYRIWGFKGTYGSGDYAKRVEYWLYDGKLIEKKDSKEDPPWKGNVASGPPLGPELVAEGLLPEPPKPQIWTGWAEPKSDGSAEMWYRTPEDAQTWKVFRYKVPVYPARRITDVHEMPDGKTIFGRCESYQGNFIYDPDTNTCTHLGKLTSLSQGSQVMADGKIYMCGYPSASLFVYDPAKPWTAGTATTVGGKVTDSRDPEANPHFITYLRTYSGMHHTPAGALGADGMVYFGGVWYRDGNGGGVAWYDPKTGKADGIRDLFGNYQIHGMTTADDGKLIVMSTRAVEDLSGNAPKPAQAKLFVLDTATKKIVREIEPIQKLESTGYIAGVGGTRVMGMCVDPTDPESSLLYGVDVADGSVGFVKKLPYPLEYRARTDSPSGMFDFRMGPDGKVWTFIGNCLVRINPADANIETVGMARVAGSLAFSGKDLYMGGSVELREEPDLLKKVH